MSDHVHQLHHQKEAIYEVSREEARQGYSSSYFLVKKPGTSEMRPVLNLKRLNWFTRYQKFKMESLLTVRKILRKRDFLTKVDLSDAYMHVPVHPAFQKYLQFEWEGRFYRFRCLPFGLQSAPRVFTKLVRQVVEDLRRKGVRLVFYLDDFLVLARSKAESVKHTRVLVQSLKDHGFFINEKKSVLEPSFQQEFLGAVVDSESMEFRVPKKKLKKFLKEARRFLRKGEKRELLTVRQLAGLIGKLQSLAIAMDQTRLRLAGLLQAQREATRRFTQGPVGWERKVLLTEAAMADLTWWVNEAVAWNGKTLLPLEFHKTVYTDASDTGYGGVVLQRRKFSPKISHRAQGFWNESEQQWSINLKEMEAVRRLLLGGVRHLGWKNMNLEVFVDNMATLWYLNKAGGSVPHLTDLATLILRELAAKNIRLVCRYVNTKDNVIADRISRWKNDRSDRMLHPSVSGPDRPSLGPAYRRLDRHAVQLPSSSFLLVGAGPPRHVRRCAEVVQPQGERLLQSALLDDSPDSEFGAQSSGDGHLDSPSVAGSALVARSPGSVRGFSDSSSPARRLVFTSAGFAGIPEETRRAFLGGGRMESILQSFREKGLPEEVIDTVQRGWADQTLSQYESSWSTWLVFCDSRGVNPLLPKIADFAVFLNTLYLDGAQWATITSACSSVSTAVFFVSGFTLSTHPLISLVKKGIRTGRPPSMRYKVIWDVDKVFLWVLSLGPNARLSPLTLLLKFVVLLKIDLMARGSDLARLFVSEISIVSGMLRCRFYMPKQWRAGGKYTNGRFTSWLYVAPFRSSPRICSVATFRHVLKCTSVHRLPPDIFYPDGSFRCVFSSIVPAPTSKPATRVGCAHKVQGQVFSLSADRIASCVTEALSRAGVPAGFRAHSTRHASSSAAEKSGASVPRILAQTMIADEKTYTRFYRRDISRSTPRRKLRADASLAAMLRASF